MLGRCFKASHLPHANGSRISFKSYFACKQERHFDHVGEAFEEEEGGSIVSFFIVSLGIVCTKLYSEYSTKTGRLLWKYKNNGDTHVVITYKNRPLVDSGGHQGKIHPTAASKVQETLAFSGIKWILNPRTTRPFIITRTTRGGGCYDPPPLAFRNGRS